MSSHDSPSTRDHLLEVAGRLFAAHGLDGVGTRAITAAAAVNLGAIHYHFGTKQDLYLAAFRHVLQDFPDRSLARLYDAHIVPARGRGQLAQGILRLLERLIGDLLAPREPRWHIDLLMRELVQPSSARQLLIDELFVPDHRLWCDIYRQAKPHGTPLEAHLWAFTHSSMIIFHLAVPNPVRQLLGDDGDPGQEDYVHHVIRHTARMMIAAVDLPLPKELR